MTDFFHLNMDQDSLLNLSSLGLAHLGDSVFEVMVRSWLCLHGKAKAKDLLVVPGTDFGCKEYFRICYCVKPEMIEKSLPVFKALIEE